MTVAVVVVGGGGGVGVVVGVVGVVVAVAVAVAVVVVVVMLVVVVVVVVIDVPGLCLRLLCLHVGLWFVRGIFPKAIVGARFLFADHVCCCLRSICGSGTDASLRPKTIVGALH